MSLVNIGKTPLANWQVIDSADYNVLLLGTVTRQVCTWLQESDTVSSQILFGALTAEYEYARSGDHNGDGKASLHFLSLSLSLCQISLAVRPYTIS